MASAHLHGLLAHSLLNVLCGLSALSVLFCKRGDVPPCTSWAPCAVPGVRVQPRLQKPTVASLLGF